jgi:uncharacterized membrane protein
MRTLRPPGSRGQAGASGLVVLSVVVGVVGRRHVTMPGVSLADVLQLLHVLSAFAFVAGLIGREITLTRARRASEIHDVEVFVGASAPFERSVTIGSTLVLVFGLATMWAQHLPWWGQNTRWVTVSLLLYLTLIPFVPLVFLPRGKVFERAMRESTEAGRRMPALEAAFADPAVAFARNYEKVVVAIVIVLMVTKPF